MQQPAPEIAPWMWFVFGITIVALLAIDHLAHRGERAKSRKVALVWSIVWIAAGLGFNFFVWAVAGAQAASEYLAVYLIEKSLSTDNMFLFLVIFDTFHIPREQQHKALFAILGLRALYLLLAHTIAELPYLHYGLAIVLAFAGIKLLADPILHVPPIRSVSFTVVVIAASVWASLRKRRAERSLTASPGS